MTWWAWTLLWVVLVAGAGGVLFVLGRSLWRKAEALLSELTLAADRLSAVSAELGTLAGAEPREEPAIFADPAALRRQRWLDRRAARRKRHHRGVPRASRKT